MNLLLKKYWQKGWISALITAVLFIYLLHYTWLKWGDLIIDIGREMYLPMAIAQGKAMLYKDICYIYGPFSPYFNALLFKLFGIHLSSLIFSGIITSIAVSILIYKISRFFLNIFLSTFVVSTFLLVFAFGQYVYYGNYNFIVPYSYAAIHGLVFVLAALYFFILSILKSSFTRYKYLVSFFIALALLTRAEMGITLLLSLMITTFFYNSRFKEKARMLPFIIIPVFLAGSVYALFLASIKEPIARSSFFDVLFHNMNSQLPFTRGLFGLDRFSENISSIYKSLLGYLFITALFILGGIILSRLQSLKSVFRRRFFLLTVGFLFIFIGLAFVKRYFLFEWQYRPLPLFLLAIILMSFLGLLKSKDIRQRQENLILLSLSVFSFLFVIRMLFFIRVGHYGFYTLVPGMILYHIFFLKIMPSFLKQRAIKIFLRTGFLLVFVVFAASYFDLSMFCYKNKTLRVSTSTGTIYAFNNDREYRCKQLIEYLIENTGQNDTLVVFPEGLTINFLAKRDNPLYYYTYLPVDLTKKEIIEKLIQDIDSKKINYIALNQRKTAEYGYPVFGRDYGQAIWEYVLNNYDLLEQFGPFPFTTQEYGIALFKRKA